MDQVALPPSYIYSGISTASNCQGGFPIPVCLSGDQSPSTSACDVYKIMCDSTIVSRNAIVQNHTCKSSHTVIYKNNVHTSTIRILFKQSYLYNLIIIITVCMS